MRPEIREFKVGLGDEAFDGVFFFDADVIDEETLQEIVKTHGYEMDNKVFKKEAPCFFLPKAQAELLRKSWVKQKTDSIRAEVIAEIEERLLSKGTYVWEENFGYTIPVTEIEDVIKEMKTTK